MTSAALATAPTRVVDPPLYVDVHVLQTVPPSNLNRDDNNSPKQAVFGGVRRARVSSQAWKRATRQHFELQMGEGQRATRTKRIAGLLASRLTARLGLATADANRVATTILGPLEITARRQVAEETSYLLFFGRPQVERLVDAAQERLEEAGAVSDLDEKTMKELFVDLPVKAILGSGHPIGVALFGRMVADVRGLNVDAATQVAHAISTHEVVTEFDYYTAVDDEKSRPEDDAGAGMVGTVEFNSSTLYRFATVGVHQLADNLDGDLDRSLEALQAFLESFVTSMPSGYQNSFGHRTVPDLVSFVVRQGQPVNLASAFETPIAPRGGGIASRSIRALASELDSVGTVWGLRPLHTASTYRAFDDGALPALGASVPFADAVSSVIGVVRDQILGA